MKIFFILRIKHCSLVCGDSDISLLDHCIFKRWKIRVSSTRLCCFF